MVYEFWPQLFQGHGTVYWWPYQGVYVVPGGFVVVVKDLLDRCVAVKLVIEQAEGPAGTGLIVSRTTG